MAQDDDEVWESERKVSDAVGRLIEFWGFKRNMGRLWAILYLSDRPLNALALQDRLALSSGAVSMTLTELSRWGVVHKIRLPGERRDHFEAEGNIWKMVSRVLAEREGLEIANTIDVMGAALEHLQQRKASDDVRESQRATFQQTRVYDLLMLAKVGESILQGLLKDGQVDATQLLGMLLGTGKSSDIDKSAN